MTVNLEARKTTLLSQIEKLKRGADILKWPEYKELTLRCLTGSVKYISLEILQEHVRN
jgi:hypothetical protein